MPVTVTQKTAPSGVANSFTDNFNRGNEVLQDNYFVGTQIVSLYTITSNELVVNPSGVSGQECFVCLGAPGLIGSLSQYMELEWISAGAGARAGPALYLSGTPNIGVGTSQMSGYFFHAFPGTINLFGIKPGTPNYTLALAIGAPVANDVLAIQADIRVADNRVRMWQNQTLLADVTDSDAARPAARGLPGVYSTGGPGASTNTWDNLAIRRSR